MSLPSMNFLHLTVSEIQPGQTISRRPPAHPDIMGENNTATALKGCGVKTINSMFFGFIWNNKPDKIKRMYITQDYQDAGLKMVNLEKFIDSLKLTWVYRLLKSQKADYHTLFETTISPIS